MLKHDLDCSLIINVFTDLLWVSSNLREIFVPSTNKVYHKLTSWSAYRNPQQRNSLPKYKSREYIDQCCWKWLRTYAFGFYLKFRSNSRFHRTLIKLRHPVESWVYGSLMDQDSQIQQRHLKSEDGRKYLQFWVNTGFQIVKQDWSDESCRYI